MQYAATLAWLHLDSTVHGGQHEQEDILDKLTNDCCPGTTEWILKHQRMKAWLKDGRSSPILWLKGKPGCGRWSQGREECFFLTFTQGKVLYAQKSSNSSRRTNDQRYSTAFSITE